jgi:hypothetical protein
MLPRAPWSGVAGTGIVCHLERLSGIVGSIQTRPGEKLMETWLRKSLAAMQSKLGLVFLIAIGTVLTGVTVASAQLPSGERQLGQTIVEPGYDDRTGKLIYIMTPIGAPNPSHADAQAVSPLFIIVYPNSAAQSVGTMNCAHEGGDNCPDHGPGIAELAQTAVPSVYGDGVWGTTTSWMAQAGANSTSRGK